MYLCKLASYELESIRLIYDGVLPPVVALEYDDELALYEIG